MLGYAGKILHVNLTNGKIWKEELSRDLVSRFLGGRGINAKLLWEMSMPGIEPLSPDNLLIFGAGALTCTTAPCSGRTTITCKSPATNLYLKSSVGGHWGAELKFAGYDHLAIHGVSEKPVYVWTRNEHVEIKDASNIWGLDVRKTNAAIKKELKDEDAKVACIGPAGENLVRFAAIMCSVYHAAGRGGAGAVMGSKNLKAIAVRGTGEIKIKDPDKFNQLALTLRKKLLGDEQGKKLAVFGTGSNVLTNQNPSYNFQRGSTDGAQQITPPWYLKRGYWKRWVGCFGCTIGCHRYMEIDHGLYAGTFTCGPEYETYAALGFDCGIASPEVVIKANDLCNIMGLDTISLGSVIAWVMECHERGALSEEDTDQLELKFGNDEALLRLIPDIAHRKGKLGNMLAQGVKSASEHIRKESYKWAMCNSKGLEMSMVETRINKHYALAFAVNPRGPDHLHTECIAAFGTNPKQREVLEKITGQKWPESQSWKYVPEVVRWHEDIYAAADSLGLCAFTCTNALAILAKDMAELFSAATEIDVTEEDVMLAGRRILTLERCLNIREGADRKLDDLPWRIMNEPISWLPGLGMVTSREWLDEILDKYYVAHGWEIETGTPYNRTLNTLGLSDVADELKKFVKLPL
jgi:aldehyde:ferredoxin oxidoreductase